MKQRAGFPGLLLFAALLCLCRGAFSQGGGVTVAYPTETTIGSFTYIKSLPGLSRVDEIFAGYNARSSDLEYYHAMQGADGELFFELGVLPKPDDALRAQTELLAFMESWVRTSAVSDRRMRSGSEFGGQAGTFYELGGEQYTVFAGIRILDSRKVKLILLKNATSTYSSVKVAALQYFDKIAINDMAAPSPQPSASPSGGGGIPQDKLLIGGVCVVVLLFGMVLYYRSKAAAPRAASPVPVSPAALEQDISSSKGLDGVIGKLSNALMSEDQKANVKIIVTTDVKTMLADGKSKSMIKVRVTDFSGEPLDGKKLVFSLAEQNGRLTSETAATRKGEFLNFYTAGTEVGKQTVMVTLEENAYVGEALEIQLVKIEKLRLEAEKPKVEANDKKGLKVKATLLYSDENGAVDEIVRFRVLEGDGRITPAVKMNNQGTGEAVFWPGGSPGKVVVRGESASAPEIYQMLEFELVSA
ncbi:MAG: invasin domain 3-containing protein [Candidatus Eremiobacteraeota bacterium]|nr:invasin domain 3-containing protein [Candidatus Eremiobacteraeota bacterium]